jgi:hypothetical protein
MSQAPRDFVFNRFESRHGLVWLAQAFAMFRKQWLMWIVLLLAYYTILKLLLSVPLVGPYAMTILKPVFAVGLLAAAWTQERGGVPALKQLFVGFHANLWSLLPIGIFYVAGVTLAVFASSLVDGGKLLDLMSNAGAMNEEQITDALSEGALEAGMLFSALLSIPVLLATWWAPALVVFQNASFGAALLVSLRAALANWKPLGLYGIGAFFYGVLLPTVFVALITAVMPESIASVFTLALLLPYGIFVAATLQISDYISYRDVFHAGETLAPLAGQGSGDGS